MISTQSSLFDGYYQSSEKQFSYGSCLWVYQRYLVEKWGKQDADAELYGPLARFFGVYFMGPM